MKNLRVNTPKVYEKNGKYYIRCNGTIMQLPSRLITETKAVAKLTWVQRVCVAIRNFILRVL